ncbi:peptidylprolyl isomerase [Noviherbaspirillum sp. ST9]|uniref:peptidylprolyl isomerase n=1 Tax=Noviherbaspirillum sp. ST9 TaxID=3401606 RepID=UPI003B58A094
MKYWFTALCLSLLASCGGGDKPAIYDISAANLSYGNPAVFLIQGNFAGSQGWKADIPDCTSQSVVSSTATNFAIRCNVAVSGDMPVRVMNAAGEVVFAKVLIVPAPQVSFDTARGRIVAELYPNAAPVTVNNFLGYVMSGFYTNTLFHRVIPNFVIQGGGFATGLIPQKGEGEPIVLESGKGLSNVRGTLAMARTSDPNSATSQFYFNLKDNTSLDYESPDNPGYAVFGKIVEGLDVMDAIATVQTSVQLGQPDVPVDEVLVKSVTRIK